MAAGDGLISMKPTSIAHAGTSASINADGGVDFTAVTSLSLNGVFTGDYDNYLAVISGTGTAAAARLRLSGTDASGSDYTYQILNSSGTAISAVRSPENLFYAFLDNDGSGNIAAYSVHIYGPSLAQPTALRTVGLRPDGGARLRETAQTHSLSTAYDGLTLFPGSGSITGTVHVFGYEE